MGSKRIRKVDEVKAVLTAKSSVDIVISEKNAALPHQLIALFAALKLRRVQPTLLAPQPLFSYVAGAWSC